MTAIIITIAVILSAINIIWFQKEYNRVIPENPFYPSKQAGQINWWNIISIALQAIIIITTIIIITNL
jgi:RsiW-degrading membrane proteinase PrsW (M82 family)